MDQGIVPHVPVWDRSAWNNGLFSRSDFVFDAEENYYILPGRPETDQHRHHQSGPHTQLPGA
jgi:hypothetical protein